MRSGCTKHRASGLFQSSPSPKTGRYGQGSPTPSGADWVPILTQSEDWALSEGFREVFYVRPVPILTQSEDWALFGS